MCYIRMIVRVNFRTKVRMTAGTGPRPCVGGPGLGGRVGSFRLEITRFHGAWDALSHRQRDGGTAVEIRLHNSPASANFETLTPSPGSPQERVGFGGSCPAPLRVAVNAAGDSGSRKPRQRPGCPARSSAVLEARDATVTRL